MSLTKNEIVEQIVNNLSEFSTANKNLFEWWFVRQNFGSKEPKELSVDELNMCLSVILDIAKDIKIKEQIKNELGKS